MSINNTPKCRNMMYAQSLDHLPTNSLDELIAEIETKIKPKKYAAILHDKDLDENGNLIEKNVHVMMSFTNARSIASVAKLLNDEPQYIEKWDGNCNNGYSYLVHRTKDATNKHQYDPSEVIANFDYPSELEKIRDEVTKSKQKLYVPILLDALYDGSISKEELEEKLTGSQYSRFKRQIDDIWAKRLKQQAENWRSEMIANNKEITVIWIAGPAGAGKTSLAIEYAEKANRPYFLSGSSRDLFQGYSGEHTIILDEFRPLNMPYQDILRVLDPFGQQVNAPSRYQDKALQSDLFVITSPFTPYQFYLNTFGCNSQTPSHMKDQMQTDSFEQLLRRITLIIEMNEYWINAVEFDKKQYGFVPIPNAKKPNPYSSINRPKPQPLNKVDLFNKLFD